MLFLSEWCQYALCATQRLCIFTEKMFFCCANGFYCQADNLQRSLCAQFTPFNSMQLLFTSITIWWRTSINNHTMSQYKIKTLTAVVQQLWGYMKIVRIWYWVITQPSTEFSQSEWGYAPLDWLFGQVKRGYSIEFQSVTQHWLDCLLI